MDRNKNNGKIVFMTVLAVFIVIILFIVMINLHSEKIGFIKGDYSENKCDYVLCEKSADGGVHNTGYSKSYYCAEHFIKEKDSWQKTKSKLKTKDNNSKKDIGEGGYEMPNENDKSVTDYIKRVAPDVYDSMEENWNNIEE